MTKYVHKSWSIKGLICIFDLAMGVKSPIRQQLEQKQYCLLHYFREIQVEQITQKHNKMKNNAGQEITIVHILQ